MNCCENSLELTYFKQKFINFRKSIFKHFGTFFISPGNFGQCLEESPKISRELSQTVSRSSIMSGLEIPIVNL